MTTDQEMLILIGSMTVEAMRAKRDNDILIEKINSFAEATRLLSTENTHLTIEVKRFRDRFAEETRVKNDKLASEGVTQ